MTADGRPKQVPKDRKRAEDTLATMSSESNKWRRLYEAVLSNTPDLGYVFDLNHRFTFANEALLTMWGKTRDEAIGKNCLELGYEPWHASMHDREIEQVIASKQPVRGEVPFTGTHGRRIYDYIFFPVMGPTGEVEAVAGSTRDITERKQTEIALRESEQRFRAITEAAPLLVWMAGTDRLCHYFNRSWLDFVGRTLEQESGDGWAENVHKEDFDRCLQIYVSSFDARQPFEMEYRLKHHSGEYRWILDCGVPRFDADGVFEGYVGACLDIHQQKEAEEALRRSEKLAAVGRLASTIAHEVNNPLEAVTNLLYLATKDKEISSSTRQYLVSAEQELNRVAHITKQTLGIYRNSSLPALVDISQAINDLLDVYEYRFRNRQIDLEKELGTSAKIVTSEGELRQVFSNLLINAVDATPPGGRILVRVRPSREWNGSRRKGVRITVADTGCGIDPIQKAKVFDAFYTTKHDVGTGLGLWLSRDIVQKHHGNIRMRSRIESGKSGTVFSIFWPDEQDSARKTA